MQRNDEHYKELDVVDMERLTRAAGPLNDWGGDAGERRYCFYRRRGYCRTDALAYALAWCRNAREQADRRKAHGTGCAA